MRKLWGLFCIILTALPVAAQRPFWLQVLNQCRSQATEQTLAQTTSQAALKNGSVSLAAEEMSDLLKDCMISSYLQAEKIQQSIPEQIRPFYGKPMRDLSHTKSLNPPTIYPEVSFLHTDKQAGRYFSVRNNRAYVNEVKRMEKFISQLEQRLPEMERLAPQLEQPEDIPSWLAQRIPPETKNLFVGEVHLPSPVIHNQVAALLTALRRAYPQREIMLFTEFLPENFVWGQHKNISELRELFPQFFPIWGTASANQIPTIGLEKKYVMNDECTAKYAHANGKTHRGSVWVSLEGVRLRNEGWQQVLAAHRQKHPDALFVIYTGEGHSLYNSPFSLTANGPTTDTFVVAFYPTEMDTLSPEGVLQITKRTGPLEQITEQADFPQRVLYWDDPQLARLSGFDVRVKLPVLLSY